MQKDTQNELLNQQEQSTEIPNSHTLFGSIMKETLIPQNLEVESSYEIGKGPPKLDVLIIRRKGDWWTDEQLEFLPDGIRQKQCKYVILELKYTESINQIAIFQTLGYLGYYVSLKRINIDDACTFLVSAKTPSIETLSKLNFEKTYIKGVFEPKVRVLKPLSLVSLNDLSEERYNLWIKLFSSKKKQKLSALQKILALDLKKISQELIMTVFKIIAFWLKTGEISMQQIEKQVSRIEVDDLAEDAAVLFFTLVKPECWVNRLKPEDIIPQFKPKDVIPQFKPEDLLKELDVDTIEKYLDKLKKQKKLKSLKKGNADNP